MAEVDVFFAETLPRLTAAEKELHNGNAAPRIAIWSHHDPVTVLGAVKSANGWGEVSALFDWLQGSFSNCTSFEYEVIAADVSDKLAYIAGIEHTTASVGGAPPKPYSLRVTTIFRREEGEWRVVHRHADPVLDSASTHDQVNRVASKQRSR